MAPRIGRRLDAVHALFHFHHHHLDGDDGVVHEKTKRQDEGAERDAVEEPAGFQHDEEHDGKRQRDGSRHDDADAPAEAEQAHQQHYAERDCELHHEFINRRGDVDGLIGDLVERHPEWQCLCDGRSPFLQRLAEREAIPTLLHDCREQDGGLTLVSDDVGGRILVAAADLGDIGELQRPPRSDDRRVGDRLDAVISAVDPDENLRPLRVDRACRCDGVLPLQGGNNILCRHAEGCQFGIGKLDEYLFGTFTEDVDLLDTGHVQEVLANGLGLPGESPHRHTLRLEGIKGEAHVRIFVVDEWAEHPGRQVAGFVAEFLAGLIELLLHSRRRRAVLERDRHIRVTRPRGRLDPVVPGQLLKPLLQRFGDEVLHLARRRARPCRRDRQGLDGEVGVLRPSEHEESVGACGRQQEDEEQGDGPFANGDRGKIEAHQSLLLSDAALTRAPS